MLKTLIRPGMIFIPLTLGICFPEAHHLNFLIRWILVGMLYLVCLQLKFKQLKPKRSHFLLFLANLLLGITPYLIFHAMGYEELALAAFFVGITPTANAAPVVMRFLHGRVAYVVTAFVVTNTGVSLALLALLPWVTGNTSFSFISHVGQTLLFIMGLPFILAVLTRLFHEKAREWPSHCGTLSFLAWSLTLFIIAADAAQFFKENPHISWWILGEIAMISLILCALSFWIGYRLGSKQLRRESSQSLGQKNTTFTLYLALTYINPLVAMGPIFYVLWHNSWNAIQMFQYDRRRLKRHSGKKRKRDAEIEERHSRIRKSQQ